MPYDYSPFVPREGFVTKRMLAEHYGFSIKWVERR